MFQREVSERIGVDVFTFLNWENGKKTPSVEHIPAIMDFLGYCPYQTGATFGERLRLHRMHHGLSHRGLARLLGVDPASISRWESGVRNPTGKWLALVEAFLHGHR